MENFSHNLRAAAGQKRHYADLEAKGAPRGRSGGRPAGVQEPAPRRTSRLSLSMGTSKRSTPAGGVRAADRAANLRRTPQDEQLLDRKAAKRRLEQAELRASGLEGRVDQLRQQAANVAAERRWLFDELAALALEVECVCCGSEVAASSSRSAAQQQAEQLRNLADRLSRLDAVAVRIDGAAVEIAAVLAPGGPLSTLAAAAEAATASAGTAAEAAACLTSPQAVQTPAAAAGAAAATSVPRPGNQQPHPFGDNKPDTQRRRERAVDYQLGGDVAGFIHYKCRRDITLLAGVVQSLETELRQHDEEVLSQHLRSQKCLPVELALALTIELDLSHQQYDTLTKYLPNILPPLCQVKKLMMDECPELQPLKHPQTSEVFGWAVKDVRAALASRLEAYMLAGGTATRVRYKFCGDAFTDQNFHKEGESHVQLALYLLLPGIPHNSPFHMIPLAFYAGDESSALLRVAYEHCLGQINARDAQGQQRAAAFRLDVNGTTFSFEPFQQADNKRQCITLGHGGHQCKYNCIYCLKRQGMHARDARDARDAQDVGGGKWTEENIGDFIKKQKGSPFTTIDTDHMLAEPLHLIINIVRSHFGFLLLLCDKGLVPGVTSEGVLRFMKDHNMQRPMMSWDGEDAWAVLCRRQEWLPLFKHCCKYKALRDVWDNLYTLLDIATKRPELGPADLLLYEACAAHLGNTLLTWFPLAAAGRDAMADQLWLSVSVCLQRGMPVQLDQSQHALLAGQRVGYPWGFYDHVLLEHVHWQLATYGSLAPFGTWFLEHANKWWKQFLAHHTSNGGGWQQLAGSREQQALKRFCLLTSARVREHTVSQQRRRAPYTCGKCGQQLFVGHCKVCPNQQRGTADAAAVAAAAAEAEAAVAAATQPLPPPLRPPSQADAGPSQPIYNVIASQIHASQP